MKRYINIFVDGSIKEIKKRDGSTLKTGYAAVCINDKYINYEKVLTLNTDKSTDAEWIALDLGLTFAELLSRCNCECTIYSDLLYSVEAFNSPCDTLEKIAKNLKKEKFKEDSIYDVILDVIKYSGYSFLRDFKVEKIERDKNPAHELFSANKSLCYDKNILEIYDEKFFEEYKREVKKTSIEIEIKRLEENCPYPWSCAECTEGASGDCSGLELKKAIGLDKKEKEEA